MNAVEPPIENNGEPGGARTRDHRIKSAMLYQLSYRLLMDRSEIGRKGPISQINMRRRSGLNPGSRNRGGAT